MLGCWHSIDQPLSFAILSWVIMIHPFYQFVLEKKLKCSTQIFLFPIQGLRIFASCLLRYLLFLIGRYLDIVVPDRTENSESWWGVVFSMFKFTEYISKCLRGVKIYCVCWKDV